MTTGTQQTPQAPTAGFLLRLWQAVVDFLHEGFYCDFEGVYLHLMPEYGIEPLSLSPHLEEQLRYIRQRKPEIEMFPTRSTARDRCPACNFFATLQELSERQTPATASVSPSHEIVPLHGYLPVQPRAEVVERVDLLSLSLGIKVVGLCLQTNDKDHHAAAGD